MKSIGLGTVLGTTSGIHCSAIEKVESDFNDSRIKTSINHFTIRQADMQEAARLANAAGFDGFEPLYRSFQEYVNEHSEDAVVEFFDSLTIHPFHVHGFPNRFMHLSSEEFAVMAQSFPGTMALLKRIGATVSMVNYFPGREGREPDPGILWENGIQYTREIADIAQEYDISIAVEWLSHTNFLNTAKEAIRFVDEINHPNIGFCLDSFHMFKARDSWEDIQTIIDRGPLFLSFHDSKKGLTPEEATDGDREIPGKGMLPLKELVSRLRKSGFNGYLSAELLNPDYWEQDPSEVVRLMYKGFQDILAS